MTANGWPIVRLGEFLTGRKEYITIDDFVRYKRARVQLHGKGIVLRDEVAGAEIKTKSQQVAYAGEFLVPEIDAKVGGFGVVPLDLEGAIVSSHYFLFQINPQKCALAWLNWFTRSGLLEDQVTARGSTNYAAIRPGDVLDFEMPLPPLAEQRRIVARIEELAAKIEEARGLRRKAVEETKRMMQGVVSNIDGELRKSHELVPLEKLASQAKGALRSGPFGSALLHSEFVEEGIPAIGIEDVQENRFVLSRRWHVTAEKAEELKRYRIKPLDLLITVMGTLGRACCVPDEIPPMISTKHIWTVTLDPKCAIGHWVSYWLNYSNYVRADLLEQSTGTAIGGLNGQKIRKVKLPLVPVDEQCRIVAYLDELQAKVDAVKRLQAETSAELDALLPSVLDRAFKGEL